MQLCSFAFVGHVSVVICKRMFSIKMTDEMCTIFLSNTHSIFQIHKMNTFQPLHHLQFRGIQQYKCMYVRILWCFFFRAHMKSFWNEIDINVWQIIAHSAWFYLRTTIRIAWSMVMQRLAAICRLSNLIFTVKFSLKPVTEIFVRSKWPWLWKRLSSLGFIGSDRWPIPCANPPV